MERSSRTSFTGDNNNSTIKPQQNSDTRIDYTRILYEETNNSSSDSLTSHHHRIGEGDYISLFSHSQLELGHEMETMPLIAENPVSTAKTYIESFLVFLRKASSCCDRKREKDIHDTDIVPEWANISQYDIPRDETWVEPQLQGESDINWLSPIRSNDALIITTNDSKDYSEVFKDIKGKTIKEIVALVPHKDDPNVSHFEELDKSSEYMQAFKYRWNDDTRCLKWILTIHGPNPYSPEWSICRTSWTARIVRWQVGSGEGNNYFMDTSGRFHHQDDALREYDELYEGSARNNEEIIESTHIPIKTPDHYICPIKDPEYYGRRPSQREERIGQNSEIDNLESNGTEGNHLDYAKVFKNVKGKTIEEVVALIPEDADGQDRSNYHRDPMQQAFEYKWMDSRDKGKLEYRHWLVRVHGPDTSPGAGENAKHHWIIRVRRTWEYMDGSGFSEYMDSSGEFHSAGVAQDLGAFANEHVINDTHIPIQTPLQYKSPIDDPEYYGRKPQKDPEE